MAEALYRKYRPQIFADVVGQEHIERTIRNAIEQDKVSHAYLFCGPRGTGKTTTARLLAKALLCEKGPTAEPDGTCADCEMIAAGTHPDVYELDAASRTGVDNVREEIIGRVQFAPTRGRYKIYIIDEVHMLSTGAFNALLKTLEEPPDHVVFILATTDPHKVPETIHSRCQRFDFRRISPEAMVARLGAICTAEDVSFEGEALDLIARRAEGGLRNALTSLEQLIAFGEGKVTLEVAEHMLGSLDSNELAAIVQAVGTRDVAACFKWTAEYIETGADLAQFVRDFAEHMRNMYVLALAGNDVALDVSETTKRELASELEMFGPDRLARVLCVLGDVSHELKTSTNPRLTFEIALTRLCRPDSDLTLESLAERVEALEAGYSAVAHVVSTPMSVPVVQDQIVRENVSRETFSGSQAAGAVSTSAPATNVPTAGAPATSASRETFVSRQAPTNVSRETSVEAPQASAPVAQPQKFTPQASAPVAQPQKFTPQASAPVAQSQKVRENVSRETFSTSQTSAGGLAQTSASVSRQAPAGAPAQTFASASRQAPAGAPAQTFASASRRAPTNAPMQMPTGAPSANLIASFKNPATLQRTWQAVMVALGKSKPALRALLMGTKAVFDEAHCALVIEFSQEASFTFKAAQNEDSQKLIAQALQQACGEPVAFTFALAGTQPNFAPSYSAPQNSPQPAARRQNPSQPAPNRAVASQPTPAPARAATPPQSAATPSYSVATSQQRSAMPPERVAQGAPQGASRPDVSLQSVAPQPATAPQSAAPQSVAPQALAPSADFAAKPASNPASNSDSNPASDPDYDRVPLDAYDDIVEAQSAPVAQSALDQQSTSDAQSAPDQHFAPDAQPALDQQSTSDAQPAPNAQAEENLEALLSAGFGQAITVQEVRE